MPIPARTLVDLDLGLSFSIFEPYSNLSPAQKQAAQLDETSPEPVWHERGVRLYQGDALELLRRAKSESFDLIFADPPYFLSGGGITCQNGRMVSVNKGEWDKSVSPAQIHEFNSQWLGECGRLLKPDGALWVSGTSHNIYSVGFALQQLGFKILNDIAWHKTNPPPHLACRTFTHAHETLLWARKNPKAKHFFDYAAMKSDNENKQMQSVWKLPAPAKWEKRFGKHPTQKPEILLDRILRASSQANDLVLDPFCGSGTTGVVAAQLCAFKQIRRKRASFLVDQRKRCSRISYGTSRSGQTTLPQAKCRAANAKNKMSNKTLTLPAIELKQDGTRLLITKMSASDLIRFTRIDRYDSSLPFDHPDQGYQRPAETPRIKKFANWMSKEANAGNKVRMPTAILLSARDSDVVLSPQGTITLKANTQLSIIDGQHRTKGFEYAIDEKGLEQFGDYELPIVIVQDVDRVGEMEQFRIVNGEQKSVRMDLVNSILTQMVARDGESAVADSKSWGVVTSRVVKMLNEDPDGPWFDKIVMPDQRAYSRAEVGEDEELSHRRIIRATSFLTSLKPIEKYLVDQESTKPDTNERTQMLFDVVDGFWRAVRELNPECFKHADYYVLLKTPGLFALHMMLLPVLKDMRKGKRDWVQEEFEVVLADCEELAQPHFWASGDLENGVDRGSAANYGSMKGFAQLADHLYHSLHA